MAVTPPLRARIVVYAPDGVSIGQLPVPLSWNVAVPHNDLSSMTLEYLNTAPRVDLLAPPCEVALELAGPSGVFQEPPDCRFLNIRQAQDVLQPDVSTKLTMPSYGWMMNKARNIRSETFNDNGNRPFDSVLAPAIIKTFIDEAHDRHNIPFLDYDFTATHDSAGVAWPSTIQLSISITAGQDLYTTVTQFANQGLFDWRMNGRTLQLYVTDTFLNRDMTTNPTAIKLQPARDVSSAPDDISYEDLVHTALIQGDGNLFETVNNLFSQTPWGNWEGFMTQSGVTSGKILSDLALRYLQTGDSRRTQITREVVISQGSPLPMLDYRTGDIILAKDEQAIFDTLRVQQITLTGAETITGNIVLGDRFVERDIRFQRRLAAMSNGSNVIGGSGVTPTPPPNNDSRVPKQVTGVAADGYSLIDTNGFPQGILHVTWTPVTQATNDTAMDIDHYRIQWTDTGSGVTGQRTVSGDLTATDLAVESLQTYNVIVAAIGSNNRQGAWSASVGVFVGPDTDAPPVPSKPIVTSRLGTLRVHWDGKDEDGLSFPNDLAYIEVEMASAEAGPYAFRSTIASSATDIIVTDQPYEETVFFRFRAKDTTGNHSGYSEVGSGATEPLVGSDIIGEVINGANIVDGSINAADKVIAHSVTAALIQAHTITAVEMAADSITADAIAAGAVTAEAIQAYAIDATRLAVGGQRNLIADPNLADSVLSTLRINNANTSKNTAAPMAWSYQSSSFFRAKLNSASASVVGRLGFFTSSLIDPNLNTGAPAVTPSLLYPVDRNVGGMFGRLGVNISLSSGAWPASAAVDVTLLARYVRSDGTPTASTVTLAHANYTAVTGGFVTISTAAPTTVPVDAVAMIPYVRMEFTNCTTAVLADISTPFTAQATGSVLIENGAITADKIVANAITATQLDALAITAKHTITGALFQTSASNADPRVVISPNANYLNQPGIKLSGGSGNSLLDTSLFQSDSAGSGGWIPYSTVMVGPNDGSGRADINLRPGGGFAMGKAFVDMNNRYSTIESVKDSNELLLGGSIPKGTALNDSYSVFRFFATTVGTGGITWGLNNGWVYAGAIGPNAPAGTARYTSILGASASAISWQSSAAVDSIYCMFFRGGVVY